MSDETKNVEVREEKECKCICHSKSFRKFLVIALGSFVGVYCALSLFAALHRPPMMPPAPISGPYPCAAQPMHQPRFDRGMDRPAKVQKQDFHKGGFERKAPANVEVEG
jgi:hypothetical protein